MYRYKNVGTISYDAFITFTYSNNLRYSVWKSLWNENMIMTDFAKNMPLIVGNNKYVGYVVKNYILTPLLSCKEVMSNYYVDKYRLIM